MHNESYPSLVYGPETRIAPIPPAEQGLQTIVAQPWLKVKQTCYSDLEGTNFDLDGNLWYVEAGAPASKMHRVNCDTKEDVVVFEDPLKRSMSGVRPGKDGRLWIPCVGPNFNHGYIFSCNRDGSDYTLELEGPAVNDMVFDSKGGYYYTDFTGNISEQTGSIIYVTPDHKQHIPLLGHLASPNGLTLSTDEKTVWITESNAMRLLRITLAPNGGPTDIAPFGMRVAYNFMGGGVCDSCEVDEDDNLYVAMYEQGRILVFNRFGWPIGQILLAGRERGEYLLSTHCAIRPGTNELYICTNDPVHGAWIFKAGAFAKSGPKSLHQHFE